MPRPGKRDVLERSRLIRLRSRLRKIFWFVFFIVALIVAMVFVFKLNYFEIKNIEVSGNLDIEKDDIKKEVYEQLQGKYLHFFPKNGYLFLSREKIESNLKQKFPNAFSILVRKEFPDRLRIFIVERNIKAVYCSLERDKCGFVDSRGYVFAPSPIYTDGVYLVITASASNSPQKLENFTGFDLPEKENLSKILTFVENFQKLGKEIYRVDIGQDGVYRFYFSEEWYAVMKKSDNFLENAHNLRVLLEEKLKEKSLLLEYVDLRLGNKIFYKFKN